MTRLGFLILLIIAAITGSIGQAIVGYSAGGCLVSAAVGLVGALLGTWVAEQLGLPALLAINVQGQSFPVVWSILGSALFVAIIALISGGRRRRY